ncbi:PAS domain S-box protein [Magnetococcales bacterium HHB-1]
MSDHPTDRQSNPHRTTHEEAVPYRTVTSLGVGLIFITALGIGTTLVLLSYWHSRSIEEKTLIEAAKNYANIIKAVRDFYAKEILSRIEGSNIAVTHNYREQLHAIPIPATMTINLARQINRKIRNIQIQIVSHHPFPWRGARKLNHFERRAFEAFRNSSINQYSEIFSENSEETLFFATPMRMDQKCIDCHNHHPDTPKRDWKVGEIRGLQVITLPASSISSENQLGLAYIVAFIIISFIIIFSVILWLVTHNKMAFAQLKANTRKLNATLKELKFFKEALDQHAIVSIADAKGNITYANRKFIEISGYAMSQLIGQNHRIVQSGDHPRSFFKNMWQTITNGHTWHGDIKNRSCDGSTYWVSSTIVPFVNETGVPFQYISIRTDISDHKRLEAETERNRRFLEALTNAIGQGVIAVDSHGDTTFINQEASRLMGWSSEEALSKPFQNLICNQGEYSESALQEMDPLPAIGQNSTLFIAIRTGQMWRSDKQMLHHRQGIRYPVSISVVPLIMNSQIRGSVIVFRDITERLQTERVLRESEERFRQVASTAHEAIITINEKGKIIFWNQAATKTFGYQEAEVLNQRLTAVVPSHLQDGHQKGLKNAVDRGFLEHAGQTLELPALRKDGKEILLEVVLSSWKSSGQQHFTAMARDVTERQRMLEELTEAKSRAEKSNQAKSDFLANMSHEIRTPMNAIIGMSHLALQSGLNRQQQDYIEKVHGAAKALLQIINDILDFSKIEAGKLDLESIDFSLDELLTEITQLMQVKIQEKGLTFQVSCHCNNQVYLLGDPLRLRQILLNLIGNAIKFTEQGGVELEVIIAGQEANEITLQFSIRDSGIGMTEEQMQNLFQSFHQADGSTTRKYGGTGLGLSISKRLTKLMKGEIWVESSPGGGSTFHFTACFKRTLAPEKNRSSQSDRKREESQPTTMKGRRILLVEDNEINQQVASELLGMAGIDVTIASNGQEGVDVALTGAFDAILMDIQMPVMDGYTATRTLRSHSAMKTLPIIAMTANAMIGDREKCLDAGMNDHISKPVEPKELFQVLSSWLPLGNMDFNFASEQRTYAAAPSLDLPSIDIERGLARTGGKIAVYISLLERFVENQSNTTDAMTRAIQQGDSVLAIRLSHTLKGVAGTIGADILQQAAATVEKTLRGENKESLASQVEILDEQLRQIVTEIKQGLTQAKAGGKAPIIQKKAPLPDDLKERLNTILEHITQYSANAEIMLEELKAQVGDEACDGVLQRASLALADYDFDLAAKEIQMLLSSMDNNNEVRDHG